MHEQLSPTGRFERLLLATDESAGSASAEALAMAMALEYGAQLLVTTVVITNPIAETIAIEQIAESERHAKRLVERLLGEARGQGIEVEVCLLHGLDPLQEIIAEAEQRRTDVIVLGRRHDQRGWMRWIRGATTVKAVGAARCSVLVVPEGATMWKRRILLATDGSRFSDAAGVAAARMALHGKLPVTVVSTIRESFTAERAAQAEAAAARMHDHLAAQQIEVEKLVLRGHPDALILATAAERGADLIVIGTHGRTGWERLVVGSVTENVIKATTLPVLAVKL